jgi:hypothetical protein
LWEGVEKERVGGGGWESVRREEGRLMRWQWFSHEVESFGRKSRFRKILSRWREHS